METPEISGAPQELYKVLEQKEGGGGAAAGFFGGDKRYALEKTAAGSRDVQVALNPDELVDQLTDEDALKERYEQELEVGR